DRPSGVLDPAHQRFLRRADPPGRYGNRAVPGLVVDPGRARATPGADGLSDLPRALYADARRARADRSAPGNREGTNLPSVGQRMPRLPEHRLPRPHGYPGADVD